MAPHKYGIVNTAEIYKDLDEGTLPANIDLRLFRCARGYMFLGSIPSVHFAKAGVRIVEDGIQAMRGDEKEPGAPELKLLVDCQNVFKKAEVTIGKRIKWTDLIEEEEEDVAWPQEDVWSDGIERGERVLASTEPASSDVSLPDRLVVQGHTRSSGVDTSPASRTATTDLPTLRPGFVRVPDWITDDVIVAHVRTHGVTAEQLEGILRMQRMEDQEIAELERSEEDLEGEEDETRG